MALFWNWASGNGSSQSKERYTKQRCLGRGSFGMVYLYKDNETNKYVAVKEIFTGDGGFEEVKKEIMNLEVLNSPHIVRLIDHLENKQENIYRLVMEYCSGGSLKDKLFNDNELLIIAEHILNGLHYMHSRGYIHRDIKPENILCCDDEKERVYKLGDLGSSKSMEHSVKTYTGTVTFMAPEIKKLRGIKPKSGQHYDNKVDVWSLGATLLYLGEGSQCKIKSKPKFKNIKDNKLRKVIKKCLIADPGKRSSVIVLQRILKSNDNDDEKYGQNDGLMPIAENKILDTFSSELSAALELETPNQRISNLSKDDVAINNKLLEEILNSKELSEYIDENKIIQSIDISMEYWDLLASSKSIIKLKQDQIETLLDCFKGWNKFIANQRRSKSYKINENDLKIMCDEFKQCFEDGGQVQLIADKWDKFYSEQRLEQCWWKQKITQLVNVLNEQQFKLKQEIQQIEQTFWWNQSRKMQKINKLKTKANKTQNFTFKMRKIEDLFDGTSKDSGKMDQLFNDFVCDMQYPKDKIADIGDMRQNRRINLILLQVNVKTVASYFEGLQKDCIRLLDIIHNAQLRFNSNQ